MASRLRLLINAVPIRPGGGLSVLTGMMGGLRRIDAPVHVTVLGGDDRTDKVVRDSRLADDVRRVLVGRSPGVPFLRQCMRLGGLARQLGADLVLTNNHYLPGIPCARVVHHLNLLRFARGSATGPN